MSAQPHPFEGLGQAEDPALEAAFAGRSTAGAAATGIQARGRELTHKISLGQQIAELDREIAIRRDFYIVQVSKGKMRQSVADYQMAHMTAARKTLAWLAEHEATIREAIAAKAAKERETT